MGVLVGDIIVIDNGGYNNYVIVSETIFALRCQTKENVSLDMKGCI